MSASMSSNSIETSELQSAGVSQATFDNRAESRAWLRCYDQLTTIRGLEENWDDAGALPVPGELTDSAGDILYQLRQRGGEPPGRIMAGPNGTILFEWQQVGVHLELEIEAPYDAEWMYVAGSGPAKHWPEAFLPSPRLAAADEIHSL